MARPENSTDVVVVGGGPGGYVAAIRAGQLGLDTTLVEMEEVGGTCLNHGCIPSKALLEAGDLVYEAEHAHEKGIYGDVSVAFSELIDWKDGIVSTLTGGVQSLCQANGVDCLTGRAAFVDDHTVEIIAGPDDDQPAELTFQRAVLATGSRPIQIPGFDFAEPPVLDSRQALALKSAPDSMLVVGAGYIGMELSTAFAKLGTDVTVVEMLDSVLPAYEEALTAPIRTRADELGIDFHFNQRADEWHYNGYDGISVTTTPVETEDSGIESNGADLKRFDVDNVLVAVGREPVTETLDLDATAIETTDRGFVETDERQQTTVEHVYAIGDVAGEPMLAHKASMEGVRVAEHLADPTAELSSPRIPAAVFTDPEVATVGLTEAAARDQGYNPVIGEFPFAASGRSMTTGHTDGFVRIVADETHGTVLGGQIVGPEASELIAELTLAIETGATLEEVASTVHTHPTLAEAVMEAADHARDQAIHTAN